MKKLLMLFTMLVSLFGCSKDNTIKINKGTVATQEDGGYVYSAYSLLAYDLTINEYDSKISNKDSFVLFIYRSGCYGCGLLGPALANYVNENNVAIYALSITEISGHSLETVEDITATPYLLIIKDGEIKVKEIITLGNDASSNNSSVTKWMNDRVTWEE